MILSVKMPQYCKILAEKEQKMSTNIKNVIGIDVGGSTTKIVGFKMNDSGDNQLISPFSSERPTL